MGDRCRNKAPLLAVIGRLVVGFVLLIKGGGFLCGRKFQRGKKTEGSVSSLSD